VYAAALLAFRNDHVYCTIVSIDTEDETRAKILAMQELLRRCPREEWTGHKAQLLQIRRKPIAFSEN